MSHMMPKTKKMLSKLACNSADLTAEKSKYFLNDDDAGGENDPAGSNSAQAPLSDAAAMDYDNTIGGNDLVGQKLPTKQRPVYYNYDSYHHYNHHPHYQLQQQQHQQMEMSQNGEKFLAPAHGHGINNPNEEFYPLYWPKPKYGTHPAYHHHHLQHQHGPRFYQSYNDYDQPSVMTPYADSMRLGEYYGYMNAHNASAPRFNFNPSHNLAAPSAHYYGRASEKPFKPKTHQSLSNISTLNPTGNCNNSSNNNTNSSKSANNASEEPTTTVVNENGKVLLIWAPFILNPRKSFFTF